MWDRVPVAGVAPSFRATFRSEDDDAAASAMAASGYLRQGLRLVKWLVSNPWRVTCSCSTRRWPPLGVRPSRRIRSTQFRAVATSGSSRSLLYASDRFDVPGMSTPPPSPFRPPVRGLVRSNESLGGQSRRVICGTARAGVFPGEPFSGGGVGQMPRSLMIFATWPVAFTL